VIEGANSQIGRSLTLAAILTVYVFDCDHIPGADAAQGFYDTISQDLKTAKWEYRGEWLCDVYEETVEMLE
jgi:hypothetical protein